MNPSGIGKSGGASSPDSEALAETAGLPFEEAMGVSLAQFSKGNKDRASHRISLQHGRFPGLQQKGEKELAQ